MIILSAYSKEDALNSYSWIESWITAFTCYMRILLDKYPIQANDVVAFDPLLRISIHGLYDGKLKLKASKDNCLHWSQTGLQRWMRILRWTNPNRWRTNLIQWAKWAKSAVIIYFYPSPITLSSLWLNWRDNVPIKLLTKVSCENGAE